MKSNNFTEKLLAALETSVRELVREEIAAHASRPCGVWDSCTLPVGHGGPHERPEAERCPNCGHDEDSHSPSADGSRLECRATFQPCPTEGCTYWESHKGDCDAPPLFGKGWPTKHLDDAGELPPIDPDRISGVRRSGYQPQSLLQPDEPIHSVSGPFCLKPRGRPGGPNMKCSRPKDHEGQCAADGEGISEPVKPLLKPNERGRPEGLRARLQNLIEVGEAEGIVNIRELKELLSFPTAPPNESETQEERVNRETQETADELTESEFYEVVCEDCGMKMSLGAGERVYPSHRKGAKTDGVCPGCFNARLLHNELLVMREDLRSWKYTKWAEDLTADELVGLLWLVGEFAVRSMESDYPLLEVYGGQVRKVAALRGIIRFHKKAFGSGEVREVIRSAMRGKGQSS